MQRMIISLDAFIFYLGSILSPNEIKDRTNKQDDNYQYTQIG